MSIRTTSIARGARLALLGAGLALTACGGGGGSSSSSRAFLSGTAATGRPLLGAEVTVKDRRGVAVTTKTSAVDGRYSLSVQGLVPPFLVRVDDGSQDGMFSVGWQAGVVNVDPLTHMIVHLYYQAHQLDPKTVFDELSTGLPMPTRAAAISIGDLIERALAPYLIAYGETADNFDPVTTPFVADGTKLDAVLDHASFGFGMTSGVIWVDDSTGTTGTVSETDFGVDTDAGAITATTHFTTGNHATRDAYERIGIPLGTNEVGVDAALSGVESMLRSMIAVMNARGAQLTGSDLLGFFEAGYLHDGLDAATEAASIARGTAGATVTFLGATRVVDYEAAKGQIALELAVRITAEGVTDVAEIPDLDDDGFVFARQQDGSWKFHGDQRVAGVLVRGSVGNDYSSASSAFPDPQVVLQLLAEASAPANVLTAADVTGEFPPGGAATESLVLQGVDETGDHYGRPFPTVPYFPAAGSSYDFQLSLAGSESQPVYGARLPSAPTDAPRLVAYDGDAYANCLSQPDYRSIDFVHPGTPLTVAWSYPTTFPVAKVDLFARVGAGFTSVEISSDQLLGHLASSGTITIPATLFGNTVDWVELQVRVTGRNGEETWLRDSFGGF